MVGICHFPNSRRTLGGEGKPSPPRGNKIDSGICEPNPTIKPPIQISHSLTLDNHPDFDGDFGWRSIEEIAVGLRPSSDEEAWDRDSDSDEEELEEDEEVEH